MSDDFVPDLEAIAAAKSYVSAAEQAVRDAEAKVSAAEDVSADADDDVTVAQAKADDYDADESKRPWQQAAAHRDLAKKQRAQVRATQRLASLQTSLEEAQEELATAHEELEHARRTPALPPPEAPELPPGPGPEVVRWVSQLVGYVESQPRQDSAWCESWAEHPEAVWRLTALYAAFVEAFVDDNMSSWWVNHFDRHAPALFGPTGIFEACKTSGHVADRPYKFAGEA